VLPIRLPGADFEATLGLWPLGSTKCVFLETSTTHGFEVEAGSPVAVLAPGVAVQKACSECGTVTAWTDPETCPHGGTWCPDFDPRCEFCGSDAVRLVKGGCAQCAAAAGAAFTRPARPHGSAALAFAANVDDDRLDNPRRVSAGAYLPYHGRCGGHDSDGRVDAHG